MRLAGEVEAGERHTAEVLLAAQKQAQVSQAAFLPGKGLNVTLLESGGLRIETAYSLNSGGIWGANAQVLLDVFPNEPR